MKNIFRKLESFGYLVTQAFVGIVRNGALSFASIAVLIACLLITGSFVLIIGNIDYNMQDTEYLNRIVVYINPDCPENEVLDIYNRILQLENVNDAATKLITKEQALLEEMEKNPDYFVSLEEGDNPYRDSVVITYVDSAKVEELEGQLAAFPDIDDIMSRVEIANTVESLKSVLYVVSVGFFVSLLVVTVFIIITTIRVTIFSRKKEIELMDAIGATRTFITMPFVIEGFVLGMVASLLAYFAQGWIYGSLESMALKNYSLIKILPYDEVSGTILVGFLAVGLVTGVFGSLISLIKYMKN
ncbi:MAG: FtsX-like permease family protein [Ruminococcaceae bacterium]|nr:FtsX-like permease family protein [Oscillospiraceae bacterium]